MSSRIIRYCVAIVIACAAAAHADSPATIYVTTGAGGQILAIPIDPATGVQNGPAETLLGGEGLLTDVTQKSDGTLYFATTRDIRRIGDAVSVAVVAGAQELRFSAYNCLFYNSSGGVKSVGCGAPSQSAGAGGKGLAFTMSGQLLALSDGTVIRIPLDALGNMGTPTTIVSSGLTEPTGIAVAAGEGANDLERGDFIVADGRFARLYDGKTGALKNAEYAAVPPDQRINFADFDADDRLWLASAASSELTHEPNGRIYRADAAGANCADSEGVNCVLASLLPLVGSKYPPAVGLALAPSSRLLTRLVGPTVPNAEQTFKFDFGSSIVEINATVLDNCELRVTGGTTLAGAATALVDNPQYALNPYLGDEGLPTIYGIEAKKHEARVEAGACLDVSEPNRPSVFIAALTSTEINPRILRCEEGCSEVELLGWWHTGPIDNDGEGGGRTDDFSDWIIVEGPVAAPENQIQFCGASRPLNTEATAVFRPGADLRVKVRFSTPGGHCDSGAFLTDPNAEFLLTIARVLPTHERKRFLVTPQGPTARAVMEQVDNVYLLDLILKDASGEGYASGTYEITIADVTPGATRLAGPVTVRFRVEARK